LHNATANDFHKLTQELGIRSVLDPRSNLEIEQQGVGLLHGVSIKYFNVSLIADGGDREANIRRYSPFSEMVRFYLSLVNDPRVKKELVLALEAITDPHNLPLVFHCSAGLLLGSEPQPSSLVPGRIKIEVWWGTEILGWLRSNANVVRAP
jgi:hypothetical protein